MSVDNLVEKSTNLNMASKQILFDYIKNGEYIIQHRLKMHVVKDKPIDTAELDKINRSARRTFISKSILIVNSFFEYGFINRK
jgi:hypothetical protein